MRAARWWWGAVLATVADWAFGLAGVVDDLGEWLDERAAELQGCGR